MSPSSSSDSDDSSDEDRQIDRMSFQREQVIFTCVHSLLLLPWSRVVQFDIFKHNFREAFDEQYGAEDLENTIEDVELKKSAINMARKLRKAEDTLSKSVFMSHALH